MIQVVLETVVIGNIPGASIVVLRPKDSRGEEDRILPICIGPVEGAAIARSLTGDEGTRPMTHSLFLTSIAALGGELERVDISRVRETVFYATLHIRQGDAVQKIDARPSDAIALAIRAQAPVFVSDDVMERAGFPSWVNVKNAQDRELISQFSDFIGGVEPDDFRTQTLHRPDEEASTSE